MSLPTSTIEYVLPKVGTYKDLITREVPIPGLRATDVLVKVHAVSLQFRDYMISIGMYDSGNTENIVPCSDMAGEVVSVGEYVTEWKKGDRVCANFAPGHLFGPATPANAQTSLGGQSPGVLTQYRTFPADGLVRIPDHLTYIQASTLPCAAVTAYHALFGPHRVTPGDYVVVQGTGGVSTFALQFAVAAGATVIATSSSNEKLKVAARLGAKHLINYRENPNWDEEVSKITGNAGADHIVEVGGASTLQKSFKAIRFGGHVSIVGFLGEGESAFDNKTILSIIVKEIQIQGVYIGSVAVFKSMNKLIESNPQVTLPVVDKVFGFDEVHAAYEYLQSQKHVGKIVIQVAHE